LWHGFAGPDGKCVFKRGSGSKPELCSVEVSRARFCQFAISRFARSRWRGGRYRVYSLKRRWSLEELTVQRYDDIDMNGDASSISMNINNCLIAQLLFLQ
jgi:hypothetical protein